MLFRSLAQIETAAISDRSEPLPADSLAHQQVLVAALSHPDWKHRLKALQQLDVTSANLAAVVAVLTMKKVRFAAGQPHCWAPVP